MNCSVTSLHKTSNIFLLNPDFIQVWAISAYPTQAKFDSEKLWSKKTAHAGSLQLNRLLIMYWITFPMLLTKKKKK